MSANIYWLPAARDKKSVWTFSPSKFIASLDALGAGEGLGGKELPALRALAAFADDENAKGYSQLVNAIEMHGEIEIVVEH